MDEKGAFSYQEVDFAGGRHPYKAFGVKIRQGLRYSANGDGYWRPASSTQGREFSFLAAIFIRLRLLRRGASFHWEGTASASPRSPPWIRPCLYRKICSEQLIKTACGWHPPGAGER